MWAAVGTGSGRASGRAWATKVQPRCGDGVALGDQPFIGEHDGLPRDAELLTEARVAGRRAPLVKAPERMARCTWSNT